MRHLLTTLAAAVFAVGLALGFGQANAAPLPQLNGPATQASPIETVGYYGYGYGYRRYGGYHPYYWRPYHYRPYNYGYHYRPYYRNYGYWNRPYYRRYW